MIDDGAIRNRFAMIAAPSNGADWDDVLHRARRAGRRRVAGAAIVSVAAIAVAAPALGLQHTIIDWFKAETAPERVQLDFLRLGVGAPSGMDLGVIPGSARKVTTVRHEGKTHVLWVAPTRQGGFCWLWTNLTGSCRRDRTERPAPPTASGADLGLGYAPDEGGVVQWVGGTILAGRIEQLIAHYADGEREEVPVVWVSPPIDAGFYLSFLPVEHRRQGHHLTALVGEDVRGEIVARQTFRLTPAGDVDVRQRLPDGTVEYLPAKALVDQARRIIDFIAENGKRQTLWLMPTTEGGYCWVSNRWSGCPPKDFEFSEPLAAGVLGGGPPVLVAGQVRSDVAVIELRYEDGDVERIEPVEGFVLHEIPSRHYPPGSRLQLEIAYDRDGREVGRHAMPADSRGVYPCDEPVDQGYGKLMCP